MKKRYLKLISVLLVSVMVICALPITAAASDTEPVSGKSESESTEATSPANDYETHTEILDYDTPDISTPIVELESRREENVKHFILPDGSIEAVIYGNAVHRKNADGNWKDIDNNLSETYSKSPSAYATKDQRILFSKDFSGGENIITLNENGYGISMSLKQEQLTAKAIDKAVSPTLSTAKITNSDSRADVKSWSTIEEARAINNSSSILYSNVKANTDLEYVLDGNNVKENIIVKDKCDSYVYTFELELSGLVPNLNKDGSINLSDSDTRESKYNIPAPYMYDANGEYSYNVYYTLSENKEGVYTLKVIADNEWINEDNRAFPVIIDPTIEKNVVHDTYIDSTNTNSGNGSSTALWVSPTKIPFIKIPLQTDPTIPNNATIISASFHIAYYYYSNVTSNTLTAGAYMITAPWSESNVTWDTASAYSNLGISTTQLSTASFPGNIGAYASTPKWVQFDISSAVRAWHSGTPNYGIAIKRISGTNGSVLLNSGEAATCNPYLTIIYADARIIDGVYKIKNKATGKYVDVTDSGTTSGTQLQQWSGSLSDGNRAQLFKITFIQLDDSYNYYTIRPLTNCGQGINIPASGTATVKTLQTEDKREGTSQYQSIAIIKNGTHYAIKSGASSDAQYLTAPSSGTNGTKLYSGSTLTDSGLWSFEKYSTAIDGATAIDFCHYLIPNETHTYQSVMYSSTIGRNGPVTYLVRNEDGTATDKATINATTGELTALKTGKVRVGATYAGTNTYWYQTLTITEDMSGTYFIKNAQLNNYMQIDDNASSTDNNAILELWNFQGKTEQKWNIIYIEKGYYKIIYPLSGLALTAPSTIDSNVTQTTYSSLDSQKWKINLESNIYTLTPKSNTTGYLSAGSEPVQSNARTVEMKNIQSDNTSKWNLYKTGSEVMLLGIINDGHDHFSCYSNVMDTFGQSYTYNAESTSYKPYNSCLSQMQNSKIFISRSHGGYDENCTWIKLFDTGTASRLYSTYIYDTNSSTALVDFSNIDIMLYVACNTAHGGSTGLNLVTASVNAGADYAIGFEKSISCTGANAWTSYFSQFYAKGYTIETAAKIAADYTAKIYPGLYESNQLNVDSYCVVH